MSIFDSILGQLGGGDGTPVDVANMATKLGISPGPYGEPEPLLCFIFGLGWAMCIVVFLLAASSHNVDEDEDDGDTTEG